MSPTSSQRDFALQVVKQLRDANYESLWAGGCVRDELLGKNPKDYDVATSARPEQVRELFGKRRTLAIGAAFGVIAVLGSKGQEPIEIATFRSDGAYIDGRHPTEVTFTTAEEDAQRRDFTINGLFYDPLAEKLIDYVGGEQDLQAGIIRAIGDPTARFREDKLRMLRAVRFATTLEYSIETATLAAIQEMAHEITVVSAERIGAELRKILEHPHRSHGLRLLHQSSLLQQLLPHLAKDAENDSQSWQQLLTELQNLETNSLAVAFAALFKSTGDPKPIKEASRSFRFTNKETDRAVWLAKNLGEISHAESAPWPQLQRLLIHEGASDLLALATAIYGPQHAGILTCQERLALPSEKLNPIPLLTGDDLVAHGLQPGRHFALLLDFVRDAQLENRIDSREQALQLVDQWLQDNPQN